MVAVLAACGSDDAEADLPMSTSTEIPDDADPELVEIYENVIEKEMPGFPFSYLEKAKDEGELTWYHIRLPNATPKIIEEFEERFPFIEVSTFEDSGTVLFERFMSEKRGGLDEVDVFQTTQTALIQDAIDEGFIDEYEVTSEDSFQADSYESGRWYPYANATFVVYMYNTRTVSPDQAELLKQHDGLWDPALEGLKVAYPSAATDGGAQVHAYYLEKESNGETDLQAIADLDPLLLGATPAADAVSRGEADIAQTTEGAAFAAYSGGAPVAWSVPEPALSFVYPQGVVTDAPHPAAARLFQEFVMSKVGQEIYAANAYPVARTDVGEMRTELIEEPWFDSEREYYDIDYNDYISELPSVIDRWKQVFDQ